MPDSPPSAESPRPKPQLAMPTTCLYTRGGGVATLRGKENALCEAPAYPKRKRHFQPSRHRGPCMPELLRSLPFLSSEENKKRKSENFPYPKTAKSVRRRKTTACPSATRSDEAHLLALVQDEVQTLLRHPLNRLHYLEQVFQRFGGI